MLAGVGEGLLHDPVGGQGGTAGHRPRFTRDGKRHRQPGAACLVQQLAQLADARLRCPPGAAALLLSAQHAEQPAHLGEGLAAGGGDGGQRLPGPVRVGAERIRGAVGLHHHDADVVRDHVVQLAGDPGPLGRGGDLRLGIPFPLQPGGPVLQARVVRAAVAHRVTEYPGQQRRPGKQHGADSQPFQQAVVDQADPAEDAHRRAGQADGQSPDRGAPRGIGGQRVQQNQDGRVGGGRADAQGDLEPAGGDRGVEGADRVFAAEHDRHGEAEPEGDALGHALDEGRADPGDQQRGRQHAVHQHRVPAQPGVQGGHVSSVDPRSPPGVILAGTLPSSPRATPRPSRASRAGLQGVVRLGLQGQAP